MTKLTITKQYHLDFNTPDLLLVLKALGGRLKDEEFEAARELGDRLTRQRAEALKDDEHTAKHLLSKLT